MKIRLLTSSWVKYVYGKPATGSRCQGHTALGRE